LGINYRKRGHLIFSAAALACLVSASTPTLAQGSTTPVIEKWRPEDGLYGLDSGQAFVPPCDDLPLHHIELGKKLIVAIEVYQCKITRLKDIAPGTLRLDANCDTDDGKSKDVITLRKIDEKSFFMRWSGKGRPEWRFVYCSKDEDLEKGARGSNKSS
jgi:hypothetical protein